MFSFSYLRSKFRFKLKNYQSIRNTLRIIPCERSCSFFIMIVINFSICFGVNGFPLLIQFTIFGLVRSMIILKCHTLKRNDRLESVIEERESHTKYSQTFKMHLLHYLHTSLEKFASISVGITNPEHHNSVNKCNACNLKSFCNYRI